MTTETNEPTGQGWLTGAVRTECAEWIWEQMQDEGYYIAGELVDLVLNTERELAIQAKPNNEIATLLEAEFARRGVAAAPNAVTADIIGVILSWEDEFLGLASVPRHAS